MNTEIITIGDELLIGQVVDTNSSWMAQEMEKFGFRVARKTTVGDVGGDIVNALDSALKRVDAVLLTGGIGPTRDDITMAVLCRYFDMELKFSDEVFDNICRIFNNLNRPMNELTRLQAMVPDGATVIQNHAGTAPCTWFERSGKVVISMPGVPYEMKWLMTNEIVPRLSLRFKRDVFIRHSTVWVSGFGESALAIKLSGFEDSLPPFVRLAYLPQASIVRLRLTATSNRASIVDEAIASEHSKLCSILEGHIISEDDMALESVVGDILRRKGLRFGVAESCTGGRIASMITSVPGSSEYFAGGVVAYANGVKRNVLKVSPDALERYGAVSREVVEQMALGALKVLDCDCSVATSGIAGPDGGSVDKPVGTVWISAAYRGRAVSECYHFTTVREANIARASNTALLMLIEMLLQ